LPCEDAIANFDEDIEGFFGSQRHWNWSLDARAVASALASTSVSGCLPYNPDRNGRSEVCVAGSAEVAASSVDPWLQLVAQKFVEETVHPKRELKELDRLVLNTDLARECLRFSDLLYRSRLGTRLTSAASRI
jgi:hypothetical protein